MVAGSIVTIVALRFDWARGFLARIGVNIRSDRPQLDLDLHFKPELSTTTVSIKNAGNQCAYNVYCFLFEVYHAADNKPFSVSSLGSEKIKAGVLGPGEKIYFVGKKVMFDGCNITSEQEVWVEYTDEFGRNYRTRVLTPNGRGDDLKVLPPKAIKYRMPRLPGLKYKGTENFELIRSGKQGLKNIPYL